MTVESSDQSGINFEEILSQSMQLRPEKENAWTVVEKYPDEMLLGVNIRERDEDFVTELASSILTQGQIQECTGETLSEGTIKVWAGHHRYWAVQKINNYIDQYNFNHSDEQIERFKLRVRVRTREFTEDEILEIQIAENLHKNMKPEEEAEAINAVFSFYTKRMEEKGVKPSITDFSRRIGLGEAKVGNAIKYAGLEGRVQELVAKDALLYSVATIISRIPQEKQLSVAMKVILYNFDRNQAENLVRQILGEDDEISLFNAKQRTLLEAENHRLAFRTAADRAARDAAGYFRRVNRVLDLVDDKARVTMTDTVRDILSSFIKSAYEFHVGLHDKAPELSESINRRILQMITEE